jgi:hypothetical protein
LVQEKDTPLGGRETMAEGNGVLSAIELFDLGFLSIPVKNVNNEMRVVTGHRAKELTHPFFLLDEFKAFYKQEPDAWAAVCGYKGLQGYLVYIDAEENKIADAARKKLVTRFGKEYREEFGSKGAHFPLVITDAPVEKRTEFFKGATVSDNLVMEVLTDWLCILPGSKHRKTGAEYSLKHTGAIPKMKKQELSEMLEEIEKENKLTHRQKKSDAPTTVDEELAEIKIKYTFFNLNLKPGLQSCPLPGHKHNDASPSLSVSADGRVANCFSVHGGMDVFKFIQLRDGCDFPTAKNLLMKQVLPHIISHIPQNPQTSAKVHFTPIFIDDDPQTSAKPANNPQITPLPVRKGVDILRMPFLLSTTAQTTTKWFLPGFVPERSICMLAAKRASMKTFMALYFAASASVGCPNVLGKPEPVPILYLDYENGEFELARRARGIIAGNSDVKLELLKNLHITASPPIKLDPDENGAQVLIDLVSVTGARIVFIDTQRRLTSAEENASETSNAILDGLQKVIAETGCSFVLLHHMRKGNPMKGIVEDAMDEIRGSSDIAASCSVIFSLSRKGSTDSFVLRQLKNRFGAERKPIQMHIEGQAPDSVKIVSDGEIEEAAVAENAIASGIWEWLVSERMFEFRTQDIKARFVGAPPAKYSSRSVEDAIAVLLSIDKIARVSKGRYSMILPKKQEKLLKEHKPLGGGE